MLGLTKKYGRTYVQPYQISIILQEACLNKKFRANITLKYNPKLEKTLKQSNIREELKKI